VRDSRPIYRETQNFGRTKLGIFITVSAAVWILPAAAVLASQGASGLDWAILAGVFVFATLLPQSMIQRVRVVPGEVRVRFWFFPGLRADANAVEGLEVVTFDPLRDFGGWGLKVTRRHGRVYCVQGRQGVRFRVGDRRYVVGSADAPALALAIAEPSPSRSKRT